MSDRERVLELLRKAVVILEGETTPPPTQQPTPLRSIEPGEDEITLEGTLGKSELVEVGNDSIPLYRGTMKVRTPEGPEKWLKFNSWRKCAVWCGNNLSQGQQIQAIGRWETNEWTDHDGVLHSNQVFSARLIAAA